MYFLQRKGRAMADACTLASADRWRTTLRPKAPGAFPVDCAVRTPGVLSQAIARLTTQMHRRIGGGGHHVRPVWRGGAERQSGRQMVAPAP